MPLKKNLPTNNDGNPVLSFATDKTLRMVVTGLRAVKTPIPEIARVLNLNEKQIDEIIKSLKKERSLMALEGTVDVKKESFRDKLVEVQQQNALRMATLASDSMEKDAENMSGLQKAIASKIYGQASIEILGDTKKADGNITLNFNLPRPKKKEESPEAEVVDV